MDVAKQAGAWDRESDPVAETVMVTVLGAARDAHAANTQRPARNGRRSSPPDHAVHAPQLQLKAVSRSQQAHACI